MPTISYQAGGRVDSESGVYVLRKADRDLQFWSHSKVGAHLMVIAPRQQGKTSLICRLRKNLPPNQLLIYVTLDSLPAAVGPESWYHALGSRIAVELSNNSWPTPAVGSGQEGWRSFLKETLRMKPADKNRLILALDEIGSIPKDWAEPFFCLLHDIAIVPEFEGLRLILVGAVNPSDFITRPEVSPFNVAEDIFPEDFNEDQVMELGCHLPVSVAQQKAVAARIFHWTGGQPYMTQWFFKELSKDADSINIEVVDALVEKFITNNTHHFPRILEDLRRDPSLMDYVRKLTQCSERYLGTFNAKQFVLTRVIGLTREDGGMCRIRNRIYGRAIEMEPRELLFVSYSRQDSDLVLGDFKTVFTPYAQKIKSAPWIDVDQGLHGDFEIAIRAAMSKARTAVLFVSPHLLTSSFVGEVELPALLEDSDKGHVKLGWVALDYSGYLLTPLARIQCLNEPNQPIMSLAGSERTKAWNDIAGRIMAMMKESTPPS